MGQVHQNVGLDVGEDRTLQEPPFWQRGPGPVWQGFMYWQYSPTYIAVQLQCDWPRGDDTHVPPFLHGLGEHDTNPVTD